MSASIEAQSLSEAIDRLTTQHPDAGAMATPVGITAHGDGLVGELVMAFLVWEAGVKPAQPAFAKILETFCDFNELRVGFADEVAALLGPRYKRAEERCDRLRSVLNEIWVRECALTLKRLAEMSKRDARQYLTDLAGMPPFVASRVVLMGLGGHAFPVDERLAETLVAEGALAPGTSADEAAAKLERVVHAGDAVAAYAALEAANASPTATTKRRSGRVSAARAASSRKAASRRKGK